MKKNVLIYGFIGILLVLGFLFVEYNKPKDINWYPSYVSRHKIPFGTRVFRELLERKWEGQLKETYRPPFELLRDSVLEGSYVFINGRVHFGKEETQEILDWVSRGNRLFVAAGSIDNFLLDTLSVQTRRLYDPGKLEPVFEYALVQDQFSEDKGRWDREYSKLFFSRIDTNTTRVLGTVSVVNDTSKVLKRRANFLRTAFGQGEVLLSTVPEVFTNYFMLKEQNLEYTGGLATYFLEDETIYLDAYYKNGKTVATSPMRIFLETKEFRWAYYLSLIGVLLYVLFQGKRKQRAIPVIPPLANQSLNFTRTIGDMYYENHQRKSIALHKIEFFLEYIRNHFYLPTEKLDAHFVQQLASRSQHNTEQIEQLFQFFRQLQESESISDNQLEQLEKRIENFKVQAHGIQ